MSHPALRAELLEDDAELKELAPPMTGEEGYLLRHLATAAAVLTHYAEAYPGLLSRRREERASKALREEALDVAEAIATVRQSLGRRQELVVAAKGSPVDPSTALAALDQLLFSLVLLTSPDDGRAAVAMDEQELDELLALPSLRELLEWVGAGPDR
jgi:hypothetical protein